MIVAGLLVLVVGGAVAGTALRQPPPKVLRPAPVTVPVPGASATPLPASSAQLMGLVPLKGPAPSFALTNQNGRPVTLGQLDARSAVVVTFLDDTCRDVCPVVAREMAAADADLGANASSVQLVAVDANPVDPSVAAIHQLTVEQGLAGMPNFSMLTGPVSTLDQVWAAYHVTVQEEQSGAVVHSDVMDFVAPGGGLRFQATPYADLSSDGTGYLAPATIARWGEGIAHYAMVARGS